jgi:hypothetical protein
MNLTARDRLLAMFLPSLMVLAAYGWFWFTPTQAAWTQAGKSLDAARAANPGLKNQVAQAQFQLTVVNLALQKADGEKKAAHQAWDAAAGRCHDARLRNDRIEKLNGLLRRHDLRLLEDSEADSGKEGKIVPGLEGLAQQMATLAVAPKPQTRKIRMVGSYVDVVAALEDLTVGDVLAIPIGLSMKEAPLTSDVREWTLIVWI